MDTGATSDGINATDGVRDNLLGLQIRVQGTVIAVVS